MTIKFSKKLGRNVCEYFIEFNKLDRSWIDERVRGIVRGEKFPDSIENEFGSDLGFALIGGKDNVCWATPAEIADLDFHDAIWFSKDGKKWFLREHHQNFTTGL